MTWLFTVDTLHLGMYGCIQFKPADFVGMNNYSNRELGKKYRKRFTQRNNNSPASTSTSASSGFNMFANAENSPEEKEEKEAKAAQAAALGLRPLESENENEEPLFLSAPVDRQRPTVRELGPSMNPYRNTFVNDTDYDFKCIQTDNGKYIHAKAPDERRPNANYPQQVYDSMGALLDHPGFYTWILYEDNIFFAAEAITPQEMLSKHKNIHRPRSGQGILAAGECEIQSGRIVRYNFLSGTYMKPLMERFQKKYRDITADIFYSQQITPMWYAAGAIKVTFLPIKGLEDTLLPQTVSDATLERYKALGYIFKEFDSKQACANTISGGRRTRGTRRRHRKQRKSRRLVRFQGYA
jgi:hypothetical protein